MKSAGDDRGMSRLLGDSATRMPRADAADESDEFLLLSLLGRLSDEATGPLQRERERRTTRS